MTTIDHEAVLLELSVVAHLLTCSRRHVRRLWESGRMPGPIRLGRMLRWDRRTIAEWVAAGCPRCQKRGGRVS